MTRLKNIEKWSTIEDLSIVMSGRGGKIRRIVGLGINAIGAGVLVVEGIRWLSI
ncbi:MAG: hypothetical protein H6R17_1220 [Proteobacteria bacterium]|nr:hypothetical protein [Pseudomonadota bacterium]